MHLNNLGQILLRNGLLSNPSASPRHAAYRASFKSWPQSMPHNNRSSEKFGLSSLQIQLTQSAPRGYLLEGFPQPVRRMHVLRSPGVAVAQPFKMEDLPLKGSPSRICSRQFYFPLLLVFVYLKTLRSQGVPCSFPTSLLWYLCEQSQFQPKNTSRSLTAATYKY